MVVALYADRLAHRRRHVVLTGYFEHVLQLPLSYHGGAHSGRLMKVMLAGTDSLWNLWLSFFREHFAAFVSLLILLPLSVFLNWRLAILLIVLCGVFAVLTAVVLRKTNEMQTEVERHYSDLAERASDALGNVALVQSYVRVEAEVSGLRNVVNRLLSAQMPVLSWWAVVAVATRASTTITLLAIFLVGTALLFRGLATLGEIVMFMSFATMLVQRLEQAVGFVNKIFMDAPRLREFFEVLDTAPAVHDRPNAIDIGRVKGHVDFEDVSFSYDGKRPAVADLNFSAQPGDVVALVGPTGAGKTTALALLHRVFDPQSGSIKIDGHDLRDIKLAALRRNIGVVFQEVLLLNRSIAENLSIGKPDATEEEMRDALARAQALEFVERNPEGLQATVGERGRFLSGGERQRLSIARALLKNPPGPHSRRGDERARCPDRTKGAGRARRGDEEPHHLRDRAQARDHPQCHEDPRVQRRLDRGRGKFRRARRAQRGIRGTCAQPVPHAATRNAGRGYRELGRCTGVAARGLTEGRPAAKVCANSRLKTGRNSGVRWKGFLGRCGARSSRRS